jgi:hypothetical protein
VDKEAVIGAVADTQHDLTFWQARIEAHGSAIEPAANSAVRSYEQ